jgi:hypothetical protein
MILSSCARRRISTRIDVRLSSATQPSRARVAPTQPTSSWGYPHASPSVWPRLCAPTQVSALRVTRTTAPKVGAYGAVHCRLEIRSWIKWGPPPRHSCALLPWLGARNQPPPAAAAREGGPRLWQIDDGPHAGGGLDGRGGLGSARDRAVRKAPAGPRRNGAALRRGGASAEEGIRMVRLVAGAIPALLPSGVPIAGLRGYEGVPSRGRSRSAVSPRPQHEAALLLNGPPCWAAAGRRGLHGDHQGCGARACSCRGGAAAM